MMMIMTNTMIVGCDCEDDPAQVDLVVIIN